MPSTAFVARDVLGRERVAVGLVVVGPLRRGGADVGAQDEQARAVLDRFGGEQRLLQGVAVVGDLAEVLDVPAVGLEALADVVGGGQLGRAVDRDPVVIEHDVEATQPEMAGERRGLVADALHQTAVAGDRPGVVIDQTGAEAVAQESLGDRHADGVGEPLAERSGRHLDAGSVAGLGVPRRARPERAKGPEVVELEPVAAEVQQRVLEDRGVTVGEHEAVAVRPLRIGGVVAHHTAVEHVAKGSEGHRRALVAALGVQWRVHGQATNQLDGVRLEVGGECRRHHT